MKRVLSPYQRIENSILKEFRKDIWVPFIDSLKSYELLKEGDKIAVCISGGKDSMLLALLLRMLSRVSDFPYSLEYIVMDPGYSQENMDQIKKNLSLLNIQADIFKTEIFSIASKEEKYPCYLCAKMRRGYLYKEAERKGCNKIALGHHLNDVIETVLMGMFYSSEIKTMPPKLKSQNYENMELIRPLYRVKESAILSWCEYNELSFIQCACSVTKKNKEDGSGSKREEVKRFISGLKYSNPYIEDSLLNSVHNVFVSTFPGYRNDEEKISFLSDYNKKEKM